MKKVEKFMQYRKMGQRIKDEVSALGFGAMRLPSKKFLFIKIPNEDEAIKIIRYAIDHGVNYVDTAYSYMGGKSEIIVGKALKDGYREKIKFLVTKLPMWKVKKTEDYDKYLEEQLNKLDTDHLDIYLLHGLNAKRFETVKELNLIKKMEEAKAEGKIKYIGFSFHDNFETFKNIVDYYNWDICLVQMNIMDTQNQATLEGLKYAHEKGMAIAIMEPLRGGKLVNPSEEIKEIMDSSGVKRTPVDWALQFLWNLPEVSVVLSGMGALKEVKENIKSASNSGIGSLSEEENQVLEKIAGIYRNLIIIPCTKCNYCLEGCNNGVNIPKVFDILNRYAQDKNLKRAQKDYKKLVKDAQKVNKKDPNGGPEVCTQCKSCLELCPQEINIPEMLQKVKDVIENKKEIKEVFN